MKRILSLFLATVMLLSVVGILPISAASSTVTLNVKSINGENTSVYVNGKYVGDAPYLSQVESGATVKLVCEDDSFIGYMDTNLNTVSESKEYSFILGDLSQHQHHKAGACIFHLFGHQQNGGSSCLGAESFRL